MLLSPAQFQQFSSVHTERTHRDTLTLFCIESLFEKRLFLDSVKRRDVCPDEL